MPASRQKASGKGKGSTTGGLPLAVHPNGISNLLIPKDGHPPPPPGFPVLVTRTVTSEVGSRLRRTSPDHARCRHNVLGPPRTDRVRPSLTPGNPQCGRGGVKLSNFVAFSTTSKSKPRIPK